MKRITTILTLLVMSYSLIGREEPVVINGIIKDKQTKQLIPFAHVIIGNQVTITNINGEFAVPIEDPAEELQLQIRYLGYETYTEKIVNYNKYYEIYIEASTTKLQDVEVYSGPQIMRRAFNNFHLNYVMEPQILEGYYKETMRDTADYQYVTEGIMDIYTPSNMDKYATPFVDPKRTRKKIFKQVDEEDFLTGNASDMAHSSIWRFDSFLSKRNRDDYHYFYDGAKKIGDHNILVVDFEPKKKGNTTGTMYIDDITYAIIKIEYYPNAEKSKFWDHVAWTEEYELVEGSFQLVNVLYDGVAEQGTKSYKAVLVINDADVTYNVPESEDLIGVNDSLVEEAEYNTQVAFWDGFHAIKLNDRVAAQIKTQNFDY